MKRERSEEIIVDEEKNTNVDSSVEVTENEQERRIENEEHEEEYHTSKSREHKYELAEQENNKMIESPSRSYSLSSESSMLSERNDSSFFDDKVTFGNFVWNDIGTLLYIRIKQLLHRTCVRLIKSVSTSTDGIVFVNRFKEELRVVWETAKPHLPVENCESSDKNNNDDYNKEMGGNDSERGELINTFELFTRQLLDALKHVVGCLPQSEHSSLHEHLESYHQDEVHEEKDIISNNIKDTCDDNNNNNDDDNDCLLHNNELDNGNAEVLLQENDHDNNKESENKENHESNEVSDKNALVSETHMAKFKQQLHLYKRLLHLLDKFGFAIESGSALDTLCLTLHEALDVNCYSYQKRSSMTLPLLPRYDTDKRTDEEHSKPRIGYTVTLPLPHPHQEVNTEIQLMEPRKRRPILDEYRIVSQPKKAVAYGADDFLVDEELLFRAYVILTFHLDTFGSLHKLSSYVRTVLWQLVDYDMNVFNTLISPPPPPSPSPSHSVLSSSSAVRSAWRLYKTQLNHLRERVAQRLMVMELSRQASRRTAQQISWYAISAQWRDQMLCTLTSLEDGDWCLLGDVVYHGNSAGSIFPNYSVVPLVCTTLLHILRKLDVYYSSLEDDHHELYTLPVCDVVREVLLPLLWGHPPELTSTCMEVITKSTHAHKSNAMHKTTSWERLQRHLRSFFEGKHTNVVRRMKRFRELTQMHHRKVSHYVKEEEEEESHDNCAEVASLDNCYDVYGLVLPYCKRVCVFITPTMVFAIQCVAAMLEMCALMRYAQSGMSTFSKSFVAAQWVDEEGILNYLLKREAVNLALAPLIGLPKLYKDLVTGVQLMLHDDSLKVCIEACRLAEEASDVEKNTDNNSNSNTYNNNKINTETGHLSDANKLNLHEPNYLYWNALTSVLSEINYVDELLTLSVCKVNTSATLRKNEYNRNRMRHAEWALQEGKCYTTSSLSKAPFVWVEDLQEFVDDENTYKQKQYDQT